jgi:anaerobic magnesium-protoporphyrin IX monomethyl ester cyclase
MEPPLGIASIKSYLEKFTYTVEIRDFNIEMFHDLYDSNKFLFDDHFNLHWLEDDDFEKSVYPRIKGHIDKWSGELAESNAGILGFSLYASNLQTTLYVIRQIKKLNPEKIIIMGGAEAAIKFDNGVKKEILKYTDYIIPGEGEEVLKELVDSINGGDAVENVKGIYYKKMGVLEFTGKRPDIKNLDELPIPSLDGFPLGYYDDLFIPVVGSRGCINKCSFCSEFPILGKFRWKSGKRICDEFVYYCEKYKIENKAIKFDLIDSLINGNIGELEKFCEYMIENNVKNKYSVEWSGKAAVRNGMTYELLKKIFDSGCLYIYFGIESGSEKVLKDMNKKFDLVTASRIIKDSNRAGINTRIFLIIGFPTETEDDFQKTLDFITGHSKYIENVFAGEGCIVAANTDLYDNPGKYNIYWKNGEWYSQFSTPEIRKSRVRRVQEHCRSMNMRVEGWGKPEK